MSPKKEHIGEMTRGEAREKLEACPIALLPFGAVEQHGPHLPLDTDTYDAFWVAKNVVKRVKEPAPVVLPPVYYGVSPHHMDFSPTLTLTAQTVASIFYEIAESLEEHGAEILIAVNGHGGNIPALKSAAREILRDMEISVFINTGDFMGDITEFVESNNDVHAGELETSTSLANREEYVRKDLIPEDVELNFPSRFLEYKRDRGVSYEGATKDISESGVLGNPSKADREKGKQIWERELEGFSEFIEDLKRWRQKKNE